ncbi:GAM1 Glucoamylase 1 [Candida maltosa Xu316]|uniref:Glucoamylase 1 n=1 Tax=Candida maltosa (strain Xu316) TaxID=1245528 RepID=M3ISW6_CANMX|nr:Glucoamylase 1 [Candida maltosa Xu316]
MILSTIVIALWGFISFTTADSSNSTTDAATTSYVPIFQNAIPPALTIGVEQLPNINNDSAVDANVAAKGYSVVNITNTARGLTGILKLKSATNIYGYDFEYLNLTVEYQSEQRLNVHIEPTNLTDVFVLPDELVPKPKIDDDYDFARSDLVFEYDEEDFGFEIVRSSTGETLFSTKGNPLVFSNQFIQFNTTLPQGYAISGLGESIHGSLNEPGLVKTLFANGISNPIDQNDYGVHPVYFDQRYSSNTTHGVFWRSSAPQEVVFEETSLTWRSISGVIDLYFFSGPDPKDVITQYVSQIGLPAMQPYWALGYHQCKWGFETIDDVIDVVDNFKKFDIKLEAMWSDIDYMDSFKDFTNDPYRYPTDKYRKFLDDLHENNQHYVPIFDAGIYVPNPNNATDNDYEPFHLGNETDVFLKNPDGSLYIGSVWPGYTVFPDFLSNNTQEYFNILFKDWYNRLPFDGIWADMNEAASYCVGSCGSGRYFDNPVQRAGYRFSDQNSYPKGFNVSNATEWSSISKSIAATATSTATTISTSSSSSLSIDAKNTLAPGRGNINYPPYAINNMIGNHDLAFRQISPNATHADGTLEYDIHNLFGMLEEKAIYHALLSFRPNKRPFIIGRSTFAGAGKYTGRWGGDNFADYYMMYFSIPQAFAFGSFGLPFFGVDACGFNGNTDMELCSRWMQLASFFPFYRNHNVIKAIPQEPYRWEAVISATKTSMDVRYSLLPYYYTLLQESHVSGMPILRALSWQFPYESTLSGVDNQFFVGDVLIVTPVLEPGVNYTKGVFPGNGDIYYDYYTHERQNFTTGKNETLDAPLGHIPLHIRGGYIIPTQEPGYTTTESRQNPFGLIVALDAKGRASGKLYLDDGESVEVEESLNVDFVASNNKLVGSSFGQFKVDQPLANVTVLGVDSKPEKVLFNNNTAHFDYTNKTIFIVGLDKIVGNGTFNKEFTINW